MGVALVIYIIHSHIPLPRRSSDKGVLRTLQTLSLTHPLSLCLSPSLFCSLLSLCLSVYISQLSRCGRDQTKGGVGREGHIEGLKDSVHNVQSPSHRSSPSICPSLPSSFIRTFVWHVKSWQPEHIRMLPVIAGIEASSTLVTFPSVSPAKWLKHVGDDGALVVVRCCSYRATHSVWMNSDNCLLTNDAQRCHTAIFTSLR